MVTRLKSFWDRFDPVQKTTLKTCSLVYGVFLGLILVGCVIAGCGQKQAMANAIPAAVVSYEVSLSDTTATPDLLCLMPGQSAMLLQDAVVVARIPYQGRELYVGEVKLEKGTMLVKPKVEGH